jgi:TMEM175 potassium channel family protein
VGEDDEGEGDNRGSVEAAAQARDVDRLLAFSDGVFAIAITLLVLSIDIPDVSNRRLGAALQDLAPQLLTYAISFAVIGRYWIAHHTMFRTLRRVDATLLWINLVLLGFIALLPFPTQVLGDYGDTALGTIVYAASLCAVGSMSMLNEWYADHAALTPPMSAGRRQAELLGGGVVIAVFGLSIPIALASPAVAKLSWLLIIPLGIAANRRSEDPNE